ncbi:MAG: TraM recognition domain-containing protein [Gemmatimonas sp.]|nr:TraM recognition domain-containing protein [Gemmatimonas sp.]
MSAPRRTRHVMTAPAQIGAPSQVREVTTVKMTTVPELKTTTRRRGLGSYGRSMLLVGLAGAVGLWAGAQYIAYRFAYHPNLGPSLFTVPVELHSYTLAAAGACFVAALFFLLRRGSRGFAIPFLAAAVAWWVASLGPLYGPFRFLRWAIVYHRIPELAPMVSDGILVSVASTTAALFSLLALGTERQRKVSSSHGSARWGAGEPLRGSEGLLIGRDFDDRELLRFNGEGHVLTLAPTRSGKGVSAVIPNLLDYPGSVVVVDVKPENAAVTARRRRELGQEVRILDPFGVVEGWDGFNPVDLIDVESPDAIDDARMIADMMVTVDEGAENVHWNETARAFLAGLMLHVKANAAPEDQHLLHVRKLATLRRGTPKSPGPFEDLLSDMLASRAVDGLIARAAAVLLQKPFKERGSVISSLHRHTEFLDSPHLRRTLCQSTFDLADLKRRRVSVFLCLPSDRLPEYHRWIRLMVGCTLRALMRTRGRPAHRVVLLLDEFQNLGRLGPVERDMSLAAGFGVQFWLFVQDIARLRSTYPNTWETFVTNSDILQAFGASNDRTTSEYLSWLTGEATIFVESDHESRGVSHGKLHNTQRGTSEAVSEKGRRLLTPDEVRRLDRDLQVVFLKGHNPIVTRRLNFLTDPLFRGQFDPNPQYDAVSA